MTVENVGSFIKDVLQNRSDLAQELSQFDSPENFVDKVIQLGQQNSYSFDKKDVITFLSQKKAAAEVANGLDDADLEPIAGGKGIDWSGSPCPANTQFTSCFGVSCCINSVC